MWKITFLHGDFVVGVFFNRAATEAQALESARLQCVNKHTRHIIERI